MPKARYVIAVHGGCGRWEAAATAQALKGVRAAARVARLILQEGGMGLDAGGAPGGETVGAVARDSSGEYAAATSTGGLAFKLPGRVGDSPIPGAGNYATPRAAASATGTGELMMRTLATKSVCDL